MQKKSDGQLQDDVVAELEWDPSVDHADIGVSVNDGVVTLAGYVKSFPQKVAAERAVRRVAGVRALAEELKVRFASDPQTADHEIAKRIVDMIGWTVAIPEGQIKVKVEHGWVTLSGTVDWHFIAKEVARAAVFLASPAACAPVPWSPPTAPPSWPNAPIPSVSKFCANLCAPPPFAPSSSHSPAALTRTALACPPDLSCHCAIRDHHSAANCGATVQRC